MQVIAGVRRLKTPIYFPRLCWPDTNGSTTTTYCKIARTRTSWCFEVPIEEKYSDTCYTKKNLGFWNSLEAKDTSLDTDLVLFIVVVNCTDDDSLASASAFNFEPNFNTFVAGAIRFCYNDNEPVGILNLGHRILGL